MGAFDRLKTTTDACRVQNQVYRAAERRGLKVTPVANSPTRVLGHRCINLEVLSRDLDAADHRIVDSSRRHEIVLTGTPDPAFLMNRSPATFSL